MNTDTPRTDAQPTQENIIYCNTPNGCGTYREVYVLIDFARQLERELAEVKAALEWLKERERKCPNIIEAEARAMVRALQEITGRPDASCAETVEYVNQLRARVAETVRLLEYALGEIKLTDQSGALIPLNIQLAAAIRTHLAAIKQSP